MSLRFFFTIAASAACFFATVSAQAQPTFYRASSAELHVQPGTLIRSEPMRGAPLGASAYRILYSSTGLHGESIAVSGVAIVPAGIAPANGRPIVAWAHPTTGIVTSCAPSLGLFVFQTMQGLREMVERGDIVVATDYPGLGTKGPHPYLIGTSEGRAVLDSVRAVRELQGSDAGRRFAVWGHSQGGQAAIYAGALAQDYAPELELAGVAAAAPATDLETLLRDDFSSAGGRNITAMALWSWSRIYDVPMVPVVYPDAVATVDRLADECLESVVDFVERKYTSAPLEQRFLSVPDVTRAEPWRSILLQNIAPAVPASIPVFLAQGTADTLVLPKIIEAYMQRLCEGGSAVRMLMLDGVGHGWSGHDSSVAAVGWIADRFDGLTPPDDCMRHESMQASTQPIDEHASTP